jgi:drug/metabolite transporter (DMT)-like permease
MISTFVLLTVVGGVYRLVISWAAFFRGILLTSISTATILFHVQPFLIMLLNALIFRERINRAQLTWLSLAFCGVVLASNLSLGGPVDTNWLMGIGLCLGGALVYAITAVAGKELKEQPPEVTTLIQTIAGALLFLPFADLSQSIALPSWGLLTMIGVLQTGVAWVLVYEALPKVPVPLIAVLSFVNPMTAIMTDWVFFGQLLTPNQGIGMVLIVLGTLGVRLGWQPWSRRVI